ncbi:MAG: diheme cytochrome c [Alphaproteobacteria bacterium]|nr:diheme cytochrome c [Alphaproteobacteria bacterium]
MTMTTLIRPLALAALFVAVSAFAASELGADERYNAVTDPLTLKECGACHMAFQPQMLPAKSWHLVMDGLSDHFGEDASLPEEPAAKIRAYLTANAADASWWGGRFMRGLDETKGPLRITETPHWIREHSHEVPASAWADPKVKSKANCVACHPRAQQGMYDDD